MKRTGYTIGFRVMLVWFLCTVTWSLFLIQLSMQCTLQNINTLKRFGFVVKIVQIPLPLKDY